MKSIAMAQLFKGIGRIFFILGIMVICSHFLDAQQNSTLLESLDIYTEVAQTEQNRNVWFPYAVSTGSSVYLFYQRVTPASGNDKNMLSIELRMRRYESGNMEYDIAVAEPVVSTREKPPSIYSAAADAQGRIYVTYLENSTSIRVLRFISENRGFQLVEQLSGPNVGVAPRIFSRGRAGVILFFNRAVEETQTIFYIISSLGDNWSEPQSLIDENEQVGFHFSPFYAFFGDREYVVYQSLDTTVANGYQLYLTQRPFGRGDWSDTVLLTTFLAANEQGEAGDYNNQRPFLHIYDERLFIAWERTFKRLNSGVFVMSVGQDGTMVDRPVQITNSGKGRYPQLFEADRKLTMVWFEEGRTNSDIYFAIRQPAGSWRQERLNSRGTYAIFPTVGKVGGSFYFFWLNQISENVSNLVTVFPDVRVNIPSITLAGYIDGVPTNDETVEVRIGASNDPAGIEGYNYRWARRSNISLDTRIRVEADTRTIVLDVPIDGKWYFAIRIKDGAGNWSDTIEREYILDTNPPEKIRLEPFENDENGIAVSNTFRYTWEQPDAEDFAGYTLTFIPVNSTDLSPLLSSQIVQVENFIQRTNIDNGLWALAVAPIDRVGNVGESSVIFGQFSRYIPVTEIDTILLEQDIYGEYTLDVIGRGFNAQGQIDLLIIDEDGRAPYDYQFSATGTNTGFRIRDNRYITGPQIANIRTGVYQLGLRHPVRGTHFSGQPLQFVDRGTIVFGDYAFNYAPDFRSGRPFKISVYASSLSFWLIGAMVIVLVIFTAIRLVSVIGDIREMNHYTKRLIAGKKISYIMKESEINAMRHKNIGLRFKFTMFVTILVVAVILSVSSILSSTAQERQERILVRSLQQRVQVLLDNVAIRAGEVFTEETNIGPELQPLTNQRESIEEAVYITITGQGQGSSDYGYVWATNDEELFRTDRPDEADESQILIERGFDTTEFSVGRSRLIDPIIEEVDAVRQDLNEIAQQRLGDIPTNINLINQQIVTLITVENRFEDDPEIVRLGEEVAQLRRTLRQILDDTGTVYGSYPQYDPVQLNKDVDEYIFYRPVLAWRPGDDPQIANYYRGMIRFGVSTTDLLQELVDSRRELFITTVIIALIALGAGTVGALFLSSIIIIPINKLVKGVQIIQDTQDKSTLQDHIITIKTRDEVSVLADTINSMTMGLVKAAEANKDLTIGKEVQMRFIPLTTNQDGQKLSTAFTETEYADFAGYYKGAKGVSGDYFSYLQLNEFDWGIIKCDVSGKGVSASLIMVQIATIFIDYFSSWNVATHPKSLTTVLVRVNDLLEQMGFVGRFAALTIGILNVKSGKLRLCHAGDNQVHIYRAAIGKVECVTLAQTPAAGILPTTLIPNGFPEYDLALNKGDVLLLFTDGMEESKRNFRDKEGAPYTLTTRDLESGTLPSDFTIETKSEEFSIARIHAIVESVIQQKIYHLERLFSGGSDTKLTFDFRQSKPTSSNVVRSLIAADKIFRTYTYPKVSVDDRIHIDLKIDSFLRRYFVQFGHYFHTQLPNEIEPNNVIYSHMCEDEQYDDLTILTIMKK